MAGIITLTNNTASMIVLKDVGMRIPASGNIEIAWKPRVLQRLRNSTDLLTAVTNGDVVASTSGSPVEDEILFSADGDAYLAARLRKLPVARIDGGAPVPPVSPSDGDILFSPVHRLEFYWDATRQKWLTDFVFEAAFTYVGQIAVDGYMSLYGVPELGMRLPFNATIVTLSVLCSTGGAGDNFTLALDRNGVEVATFDAVGYSTFDLTANTDMLPVAAGEEGYQFRLKSTAGTPPQNFVVNVSYRIKL